MSLMQVLGVDDASLLVQMQRDDEAAFEALFDTYWKQLYQSALKRLHNREEAEDIVQEVLASLWKRRATVQTDANGSLRPYLFTALRYRIISFYAAVKTERFQGEVLEKLFNLEDHGLYSLIISKELQQLIHKELMSMPENMKRAYQLTRQDNYSIKEVASMLQLSEQTVKNLISTSSRKLRTAIESYYANELPQPLMTVILLAAMTKEWL